MKKKYRSVLIISIWILLWQLAAVLINKKIIFVGPLEVAKALAEQIWNPEFWQTIFSSSARICGGFLAAFLIAALVGIAASQFSLLQEFLEPAVGLLQSVPVASFVILALIWIGSENLSILISMIVVFPVIYRNTVQGMQAADNKMLELAQVFRLGWGRRFLYIYRPAMFPYLISASKIAFGMAWKSGVAAEVIGVPDMSIGEKLYMAKIYLSTAELFAWTLVIIVVSRVLERGFLWVLGWFEAGKEVSGEQNWRRWKTNAEFGSGRKRNLRKDESDDTKISSSKAESVSRKMSSSKYEPDTRKMNLDKCESDSRKTHPDQIVLRNISKTYQDKVVLQNFSMELESGGIYCLMGPSGIGKTTLLRILMGLEAPDAVESARNCGERIAESGSDVDKCSKSDSDVSYNRQARITEFEQTRISAVFQENRLFSFTDAVKNIRLAAGREDLLFSEEKLLGGLLEREAWKKPVSQLSGGMQRRVAVLRALAVKSDFLIMDEPFTGLDPKTKERLIAAILKYRSGRTLLVVTHQEEDARLLGAEVIRMERVYGTQNPARIKGIMAE